MFNLAELVCNEIKLAITFGHIKIQYEIQFLLENLTKITEVCQLKSKKVDPSFISELIEGNTKQQRKDAVPQHIDVEVIQQYDSLTTKPITLKHNNRQRQSKCTVKNQTEKLKSAEKGKNYHYKNNNRYIHT